MQHEQQPAMLSAPAVYAEGKFVLVMGRPLFVMGSCDSCSRTERCTSAAVICENLDYKFQILSPETLQDKFWESLLM